MPDIGSIRALTPRFSTSEFLQLQRQCEPHLHEGMEINSIAKPATHQATTIYKFKSATKPKSTYPYHFSIFYLDDSTVANIYSGLCVCAPLTGHRIGR